MKIGRISVDMHPAGVFVEVFCSIKIMVLVKSLVGGIHGAV